MSSLEKEFKKLVDSLYQQIQEKRDAGILSFHESQMLRDMVYNRVENPTVAPPRSGWKSSACYISSDDSYDDSGWSPSMVC